METIERESKESARYRVASNEPGSRNCALCVFYRPKKNPQYGKCGKVRGLVSMHTVCDRWRKPNE